MFAYLQGVVEYEVRTCWEAKCANSWIKIRGNISLTLDNIKNIGRITQIEDKEDIFRWYIEIIDGGCYFSST